MSRVAKKPITLPAGVDVALDGRKITVKGKQGTLSLDVHPAVVVQRADGELQLSPVDDKRESDALAGTTRALVANMITGVSTGFERKLQLVGVGYRAQVQGKTLNLSLGMSHPVNFEVPPGVTVETPSQTEILVKGADKQQVGQVAAKIRAFRSPEPYKGKGVRYSDETIVLKEAKKK